MIAHDTAESRRPEMSCKDADATLDDLREAVTTLEDSARIARRVMGGAHPTTTVEIEGALRDARIILRARGGA